MKLTRRRLLQAGLAGAVGSQVPLGFRAAGASAGGHAAPLLVCVFLRGGADGLALVPPVGDPRLRELRDALTPTGALPVAGAGVEFALHPALAPLSPLADAGHLAVVPAVGLPQAERSHFAAQDLCELGGARPGTAREGWLARALAEVGGDPSPLRAIAANANRPRVLAGDPGALAIDDMQGLRSPARTAASAAALAQLWNGGTGAAEATHRRLAGAGREALGAIATLTAHADTPLPGAVRFPRGHLGRRLELVARLARAEVGLTSAWVDADGWDTHVRQGNAQGPLARLAAELGAALAALWEALPEQRDRLLVLVVSEFGRTVRPNGSGGSDHGRGGVALALGGRVRGGVHGRWPGLGPGDLEDGRDLRVTTDVRSVFAVGARHLGARDVDAVLPGVPTDTLELVAPLAAAWQPI